MKKSLQKDFTSSKSKTRHLGSNLQTITDFFKLAKPHSIALCCRYICLIIIKVSLLKTHRTKHTCTLAYLETRFHSIFFLNFLKSNDITKIFFSSKLCSPNTFASFLSSYSSSKQSTPLFKNNYSLKLHEIA